MSFQTPGTGNTPGDLVTWTRTACPICDSDAAIYTEGRVVLCVVCPRCLLVRLTAPGLESIQQFRNEKPSDPDRLLLGLSHYCATARGVPQIVGGSWKIWAKDGLERMTHRDS